MKITILGCGHTYGTPMIGDLWFNCDPKNPKNSRTRASVLVQHKDENILIDSSPDLRAQLLSNKISDIHAVLYTHDHSDHCHGINDIGVISRAKKKLIPIFSDQKTFSSLEKSFDYAFDKGQIPHYASFLENTLITPSTPFSVCGLSVLPIKQDHGYGTSLGFRMGNFAYSTDVKNMPEKAFKELEGIDTWVVDCLKEEEHPTHSHLSQTLEWIERVKPKRAILTHMHPLLDYETLQKKLPKGVEPAYDGLSFNLPNK